MHTERIQKYLDGKMSEEELKKFREDLIKDPELLQELDLHRSLGEIINSRDEIRFRRKLDEAYKTYKIISSEENEVNSGSLKFVSMKKLALALPVIAALVVILYFSEKKKFSNDTIFKNYLKSYNKELTSRDQQENAEEGSLLVKAVDMYLQTQYSESSEMIKMYLRDHPGNVDAHFYNGLCNIYLNDFRDAISSFEFILQQPYSYYQEYARWYLALCYIKTNNNDTARTVLKEIIEANDTFSDEAKEIFKKLR